MNKYNGKGPVWLRGPSVGRSVCVLFVGVFLFIGPILLVPESNKDLAGKVAMVGRVICAIAIIDFFISVFTIGANKSKGQ